MALDETPQGNKSPDLTQLIAEEKFERERQNEILDDRNKKSKRKRLAIIIPIIAVSALIVGVIAFYNPFAQNIFGEGSATQEQESGNGTNGSSNGSVVSREWWETADSKFPVSVPEWAKEEAITNNSKSSEEAKENEEAEQVDNSQGESSLERFDRSSELTELQDTIRSAYQGQTLANVAMTLPSLEGGYTDDVSKAVNEDGSLNTAFTFWSREGFTAEMGIMINRLLNPVFGGWNENAANGATEETKDKLSDLFTNDWLNSHEPGALPIVTAASPVPVDGVSYLPAGGTRWVGTVNSEEILFTFDRELNGYRVDYTADVTYTAWMTDKTKKSFNGKLHLKLIPNSLGQNPTSGNRVLIEEASVTF